MNPELLAQVASSTGDSGEEALALWQAGQITEDDFVAAATAAMERGEAEATVLADLGVASTIGAVVLGLLRRETPRAREAANLLAREARGVPFTFTGTGREERVRWRAELEARVKLPGLAREEYVELNRTLQMLDRIGIESRAVVTEAGQEANQRAIRGHDSMWTRAANSGACEMCRGLADGTVMSASTPMHSHKGCSCAQRAVPVPA